MRVEKANVSFGYADQFSFLAVYSKLIMGFFQAISIIQLKFALTDIQSKGEPTKPRKAILIFVSTMVGLCVLFNIILSVQQYKT